MNTTANGLALFVGEWCRHVGKDDTSESAKKIPLDTMLDSIAAARFRPPDGGEVRFDGIDYFPTDEEFPDDDIERGCERVAEMVTSRGLQIGSIVPFVWQGSAGGDQEARERYFSAVKRGVAIAKQFRKLQVRTGGVIRLDSATSVDAWRSGGPEKMSTLIAESMKLAVQHAAAEGENCSAEIECCWGGMHTVQKAIELFTRIDEPTFGLMLDMAHICQAVLGTNEPTDGFLPQQWEWNRQEFDAAVYEAAQQVGPYVNCFHVAQTTLETFGSGSHERTGRHALPDDPNGKLEIPLHASLMSAHIPRGLAGLKQATWDSCMIDSTTLREQRTWDRILQSMCEVRQRTCASCP